jgi:fucose permease
MLGSFVLLGAPMAAVAVAWPSMAGDFGLPLGTLGVLSLSFGGGYTLSTLAAGAWGRRATTELRLAVSVGVACGALVVIAVAPTFAVLVAATLVLGITGGQVDAAVNAYVSLRGEVTSMGVIHASYGLGVALAPLLVVALAAGGISWRAAIAVLAVAQAGVAGGFLAAVRRARARSLSPAPIVAIDVAGPRRRTLVLSVLTFMIYGGVAGGTGTWAYTVLTEHGTASPGVAGVAVAAYWAGLTLSRLLLGAIERRIRLALLPQVTVVATLASLTLFWLGPAPALRMAGLVLSGVAHGPFFPVQTLLTTQRFGPGRAPAVVGYQIAAATFGGAVFPGAIGAVVAWQGLGLVRPALVAIGVGLVVVTEMLVRVSRDASPDLAAG